MLLDLGIEDVSGGQSYSLARSGDLLPDGFLSEGREYRITAHAGADEEIHAFVSGEELSEHRVVVAPASRKVSWTWTIEFYAGEAYLQVVSPSMSVERTLDVSPSRFKLGAEYYHDLLAELQEMAESVVFGLTAGHQRLDDAGTRAPLLARYAMLKAHMKELEAALFAISDAPHRRLRSDRAQVFLHQAKRTDNQTLRSLLRNPVALAGARGKSMCGAALPRIDVPVGEHTFATPPNRYVSFLVRRLMNACDELVSEFRQAARRATREDPALGSRASQWGEEVEASRKKIKGYLNVQFLSNVKPSPPDASALVTVSRQPAYARFAQICHRILHPSVALGADPEKALTLRPSYDLYEYWSFFKLAQCLQAAYHGFTWTTNIEPVASGLLIDLPEGSSIVGSDGNRSVSLTFQVAYKGLKLPEERENPYSITNKCKPDFILELNEGERKSTVLFDAKYRYSRDSIHGALSEMHRYRDAVRCIPSQPFFDGAYIVVPSCAHEVSHYFSEAYRSSCAFGGFVLSPGRPESQVDLVEFLVSLFSSD